MSTADASRDESAPAEERERGPEEREAPSEPSLSPRPPALAPSSPTLSAAWLLRATAWVVVVAGALGVILAPGVHGNASERVVDTLESASAALAVFAAVLLVTVVLWGMLELMRAPPSSGVPLPVRGGLVGAGASVVMLALFCSLLRDRPVWFGVLLEAFASVAAIAGAYVAARKPHTRALAGVLFALAFAAVGRLGAWELAGAAGERASLQLFAVSRGLATAGVLFEAMGQLLAVTWLGTRSKLAGQVGASLALVLALVLTYGVARGVHAEASLWQSVLHTALADAPGVPQPYGLDALATFLVPASLLLALVAAAQPNQVVAVTAVALALVSRGALDAPLRALSVVAAAAWGVLACTDDRAMWRTLVSDRQRKLDAG